MHCYEGEFSFSDVSLCFLNNNYSNYYNIFLFQIKEQELKVQIEYIDKTRLFLCFKYVADQ